MINKYKVQQEFLEISKDEKLLNTIKKDSSIVDNIVISFLSIIIGSVIIQHIDVYIFTFIVFAFILFKNQKLMDGFIMNNTSNTDEVSKILATISKIHYNTIFIKISVLLILYGTYLSNQEYKLLYELTFYYMFIEIVINLYYLIFNNKFYSYYIAYLFKRVDLYLKNEIFENIINDKFNKYYGDKQ